jgi:hypothetical protein
MKLFKGICTKEIFWNARTYRQGDSILIDVDDLQILKEAGVVGDIAPYVLPDKIEYAVKEAPENEMKPYKRRGRQLLR